jgi:hypothetical protein
MDATNYISSRFKRNSSIDDNVEVETSGELDLYMRACTRRDVTLDSQRNGHTDREKNLAILTILKLGPFSIHKQNSFNISF